MTEENILNLFHHIHHNENGHEVHHCGGKHKKIDPAIDYAISHCLCGKHRIDKETAMGHATSGDLNLLAVEILFTEKCPEGGWHIESGKMAK